MNLKNLPSLLSKSPLAQRFLGGAAWSIVGSVISNIINLATLMFVARILGKEVYGQFIIVQSTIAMVGVFAGFGIGTAAIRYVAELRSRDVERLARILALTERATLTFGLLASVLLALITEVIANRVLKAPEVTIPISIAVYSITFIALDSYQKSVLIGLESMRAFAMLSISCALLNIPILLILTYVYGVNGAAGGLVFSAIISASMSRYQMKRQLKKFNSFTKSTGCLTEWRILRDFALPALVGGLLVVPSHWICQAMLANTNNGFNEIALLGVAMQWFNIILFLPTVAGRVILPILINNIADNNQIAAIKLLMIAIAANAIACIPIVVPVIIFKTWILELYGAEFMNGDLTLIAGVITACILSLQTPVGNMITAVSRMWLGVIMNMGWAILYIGISYHLIAYGAVGIMIAMGIAYVVHALWTFGFALSLIKNSH